MGQFKKIYRFRTIEVNYNREDMWQTRGPTHNSFGACTNNDSLPIDKLELSLYRYWFKDQNSMAGLCARGISTMVSNDKFKNVSAIYFLTMHRNWWVGYLVSLVLSFNNTIGFDKGAQGTRISK